MNELGDYICAVYSQASIGIHILKYTYTLTTHIH